MRMNQKKLPPSEGGKKIDPCLGENFLKFSEKKHPLAKVMEKKNPPVKQQKKEKKKIHPIHLIPISMFTP